MVTLAEFRPAHHSFKLRLKDCEGATLPAQHPLSRAIPFTSTTSLPNDNDGDLAAMLEALGGFGPPFTCLSAARSA